MRKRIKIKENYLEIPEHIEFLDQHVIEYLLKDESINRKIIGCGIDPEDNSLYLISGILEVKNICKGPRLVPEKCFPDVSGDFINIKFANNESFYRISSLKALEISKSCLGESSLFFNDKKICELSL